jgi:replication factor A1
MEINVKPLLPSIFYFSHTTWSIGAQGKIKMILTELRPGMENIDLLVKLLNLNEPREIPTNYGVTHTIVEGIVEDESGKMGLTIWNEKIEALENISLDSMVELVNCFITSFKGVLSINVGRDSEISPINNN